MRTLFVILLLAPSLAFGQATKTVTSLLVLTNLASRIPVPNEVVAVSGVYNIWDWGTGRTKLYRHVTNAVIPLDGLNVFSSAGGGQWVSETPPDLSTVFIGTNIWSGTNTFLLPIVASNILFRGTSLGAVLDGKQATNSNLTLLSTGDGSFLTSTGATNASQLVTLAQLQTVVSTTIYTNGVLYLTNGLNGTVFQMRLVPAGNNATTIRMTPQ